MAKTIGTIQPGILVALATSVTGGTETNTHEIGRTTDDKGREIRKTQTTTIKEDAEEYDAAQKVRGACRSRIAAGCLKTAFGLLVPDEREASLLTAIDEALTMRDEWNGKAAHHFVRVNVLPTRVAKDNEQAARAIVAQVRDLIIKMREAVKACNKDTIREACDEARQLGQMLSPELAEKVTDAVAQGRSIARKIVARVEKAGESAAALLAEISTKQIDEAQFTFLDLAPIPAGAPALDVPPVDAQQFAGIDDETGGLEGLLNFGPLPDDAPAMDDGTETGAPEIPDADADTMPTLDTDTEAA